MAQEVHVAAVGLTKVDLTGKMDSSVFDFFAEAYRRALQDSAVRRFDALQVGIMNGEELENRANIATEIADDIGPTGVPAIRSETASSTDATATAFHEPCYEVASGHLESVIVLAGERMNDDGDHDFQVPRSRILAVSRVVDAVRGRLGI